MVSSKFLTFSFWWNYTFWNVLITICLFLENVCLCVCDKNFVASVARELTHRISWSFTFRVITASTFKGNRSTSDAVITFFQEFLGQAYLGFLLVKILQKIYVQPYVWLEIRMIEFRCIWSSIGSTAIPFFPKFLRESCHVFCCMESNKIFKITLI